MLESSMRDSSNMQARPVAGKGAKGHRTIHSYTTALYRLLATRRCLTAYARARGAEPGCQARARRARGAHAGGGALRPEPDDLAPQPLNLQLLRLHLPLAGNACRGSAANSFDPFAQHVLVHVQIARRLRRALVLASLEKPPTGARRRQSYQPAQQLHSDVSWSAPPGRGMLTAWLRSGCKALYRPQSSVDRPRAASKGLMAGAGNVGLH